MGWCGAGGSAALQQQYALLQQQIAMLTGHAGQFPFLGQNPSNPAPNSNPFAGFSPQQTAAAFNILSSQQMPQLNNPAAVQQYIRSALLPQGIAPWAQQNGAHPFPSRRPGVLADVRSQVAQQFGEWMGAQLTAWTPGVDLASRAADKL